MALCKRDSIQQPLFVSAVDLTAIKPQAYYDEVTRSEYEKIVDRSDNARSSHCASAIADIRRKASSATGC